MQVLLCLQRPTGAWGFQGHVLQVPGGRVEESLSPRKLDQMNVFCRLTCGAHASGGASLPRRPPPSQKPWDRTRWRLVRLTARLPWLLNQTCQDPTPKDRAAGKQQDGARGHQT